MHALCDSRSRDGPMHPDKGRAVPAKHCTLIKSFVIRTSHVVSVSIGGSGVKAPTFALAICARKLRASVLVIRSVRQSKSERSMAEALYNKIFTTPMTTTNEPATSQH